MQNYPSLWRIVETDYTSKLAFLSPLVVWGIGIITRFVDPEASAWFLKIAPPVTVVAFIILLWRIRLIRSVFTYGEEVPGVIHAIGFFRGRGRVEYIYTYGEEKYRSSNAIHQTKRAKALQLGQNVTVVLDREHPKRAFIKELYL